MANSLETKLQEIIEALSNDQSGSPPSETEDKLKWYLDEITRILKGNGGDSCQGAFVREFNGRAGVGVSVDASGNSPADSGREGDCWFTLAFNSAAFEGIPAGWIVILWTYTDGAWEFSKSPLPIAAKDLHWVAVQNGSDIEGHYIILSGPNETDLPKWELLGAAAVAPDGETIDYNADGKLAVKASIEPVMDTWAKTGRKHAGKDIWWRRFAGNLAYQEDGEAGSIYFKDTLFTFADNGANIHIRDISGEAIPNCSSVKTAFPSHGHFLQHYYSMGGHIETDGNLALNCYSNDIATDALIAYDVCVEVWTEDGGMPA